MIPERGTLKYMRPLWNVYLDFSNGTRRQVGFFMKEDAIDYLNLRMGNGSDQNETEGPRSPEEAGTSSSNSAGNSNKRINNERAGILPMDARS